MPDAVVGGQFRRTALPGDAAPLDDGVAVGQGDQAIDVFVHHQDGLPGLAQVRQAGPDFFPYQGRQAFGGLVEDKQPGIGDQGTADGEHLLLAAGKLVAEIARPLGEAGKRAKTRAGVHGSRRPLRLAAKAGGAPAPSGWENLAPSGTRAMPARPMRSARQPSRQAPARAIRPPRTGSRPQMARMVVVLPMPLRPSRVATWPSSMANSTPKSTCEAVGDFQALDFEKRVHAPSPGRRGAPRVPAHGLRLAGEHQAAADQDGNPVGQAEHGVHVVFDKKDGDVAGQVFDQIHHAFGLLRPGAGHRFVEEQELRPGGQRHGQLGGRCSPWASSPAGRAARSARPTWRKYPAASANTRPRWRPDARSENSCRCRAALDGQRHVVDQESREKTLVIW